MFGKFTHLSFLLFISGFFVHSFNLTAQTTYKSEVRSFPLDHSHSISSVRNDFFVNIQNIDTIRQGNLKYSDFVQQKKKEIAKYDYSFVHNSANKNSRLTTDTTYKPKTGKSFEGNPYNGSVPNDNTMAISKDGIVVAAINTNIIFYDINNDSLLKIVSLSKFSDTLTAVSKHQYDPKAIYDYKEDKFILVYLAGASSDNTSDIIVAFSETNDPLGNWNFYTLPGDAVNDTSWSDYPAIALNDKELIVTINLLKYGGSWQTAFRQSVVWQVGKSEGYKGDSIHTRLFHDIKYNGINIRNIHPVRGGSQYYGPEVYLLSNQNFALESDTFFLMKITDSYNQPSPKLEVNLLLSDAKYGMPPNARQIGSKRLATNDARVLGAFFENGEIQFVGNSIHISGTDKYAGFYHGLIKGPDNATDFHLTIYNDKQHPNFEYGYPNISYCGTNSKSQHSIITVNYSAADTFPGFGAIFFERDSAFSTMRNLHSGNTYIRVLWSLQRWGDYSGTQPMYGQPGKVWASGTFGKVVGNKRAYGTWVAELYSPVDDPQEEPVDFSAKAFPNPPLDYRVSIEFNLPEQQEVQIEIIDMNGRIVATIFDGPALAGKNVLSFSTVNLENGFYVVRIRDGKELLYSQKIMVVQ